MNSLSIYKIILFCLLLFAVSCEKQTSSEERQSQKKAQIELVRNSVVSFTIRFKDGKEVNQLPTGTGFFISEKYIVTAWHVSRDLVKDRDEISEKYIEIVAQKTSSSGDKKFITPVTLVAEDKENDLALFSFNSEDKKKQWSDFIIQPQLLSDKLPEIGDEILLTGFFNTYKQPFSSIGTVSMIGDNEFKEKSVIFNQAIFSDATSLSGHSGGPLYSFQTQKVIGINIRVLNPNNDKVRTSISANSLHLIRLLNETNVSANSNQNTSLDNK